MSLKYAILGFLSREALTGYELKKQFDRSVKFFWPADQSQIYRTLANLVKEGLVVFEEEPSPRVLDLKRYSITETGKEALQTWLAGPLVASPIKDGSLIQVFFYSLLPKEKQLSRLKDLIEKLESEQTQYSHLIKTFLPLQAEKNLPPSLFFSLSTLEYGLESTAASLIWAKSLYERIAADQLYLLNPDTFTK